MNEITINFSEEASQDDNTKILISAENSDNEELMYKFIIGINGKWDTLKEFSLENNASWIPSEDGHYIIMVQGKRVDGTKPFDYVQKNDYFIGNVENKIINNISLDKENITVGDKINLSVETNRIPVLLRYWIKEQDNWRLIRDYSAENTLSWSVKGEGTQEVLIECKDLNSKSNFDDFGKVYFNVLPYKKLEIKDYKCISSDILVNKELTFQVDASNEDNRMILYKFIKINPDGTNECIQDFSNKRIVSYKETKAGTYKLLCLARDMYSQNSYDDRAVLNFDVAAYKNIEIKSFTTDFSSPQNSGSNVELKAIVTGGHDLLYRFIIDGNSDEDSGYIRNSSYLWKTKSPGEYTIQLWVKDSSYEEAYEVEAGIDFIVDEGGNETVVISEVIVDRNSPVLKNDTIKIKAMAEGSLELRYSFIVFFQGKEIESVKYGRCNWVNFVPEKSGKYQLDIRVKDKFSRRDYDSHEIIEIEALDYFPGEIQYVLIPGEGKFVVDDKIQLEVITKSTKDTLVKYILKINGHKAEETGFSKVYKYLFTPRCAGEYSIEIYARNINSDKDFDSNKEIKIIVEEAQPITNSVISCDKTNINYNESANFTMIHSGGKSVLYEFYLMEKGEWQLVQSYSRKNFYSFVAFSKGKFKILALSRSEYKECSYEDYAILEFCVEG